MPLYNQTEHLIPALNSLLRQTYPRFRLVIVDDSTSDEPERIVKQRMADDDRIQYIKNRFRKGMVDNWKACFLLGRSSELFAWVADHDIWHRDWLARMVTTLDANPSALLAYPQTVHITPAGQMIPKAPQPLFSTSGLSDRKRIKAICEAQGFGNMIYGLFRSEAVERSGVFRRVMFPDVILIHEIGLLGDIVQVEAPLWQRRTIDVFSIARQKNSLFAKKPLHIFLPWPLVNAFVLTWHTVIFPRNESMEHRRLGLEMVIRYLFRWFGMLGTGSRLGSIHEWTQTPLRWVKNVKIAIKKKLRLGKYKASLPEE